MGAGIKAPGKVRKAQVKASVAKGKVAVRWKPVVRADSYMVRIVKPSGSKYTKWRKTIKRNYVFKTRLRAGEGYRVQIRPVGDGGKGPITTVKLAQR